MLRFFIGLFIALSAQSAMASGKLIAQINGYDDAKKPRPMVGFTVYEKVLKGLAVNSFVGAGVQELEVKDDVNWFIAKAQLDFELAGKLKHFTLSPGLQYKDLIGETDDAETMGFLRVTYQVW